MNPPAARGTLRRRLLWFAGLWAAGVLIVSAAAGVLKVVFALLMRSAGG
jgi:hypothetical protein